VTWTYTDPSDGPKDAVRFIVGDIDTDDQLVSDEEIFFLLDEFSDVYVTAASVAEAIAAQFAREITHSGDGLSFSGSDLHKHYMDLAERLRQLAKRRKRAGAGPYVGGISWAEREAADKDSDKIPTAFRSHMHDHPNTSKNVHNDPLKGEQW